MQQALEQLLEKEDEIVRMVRSLPTQHCTAFAAACCERLIPNYQAFSVVHHWGDFDLLQRALDMVWQFLGGVPIVQSEIESLLESLGEIVPDLDEHKSIFAEQAMCAVDAVVSTLRQCISDDKEHVANVIDISMTATETYLRDVALPYSYSLDRDTAESFDRWIWLSPLLLDELDNQNEDLEALRVADILTIELLSRLRQTARASGVNLIKRGVVLVS